jgi:glucose 1-dehydrogenase
LEKILTSRFENKTVIVTGAGAGIGFALCRAFAGEGARVALVDMNADLARDASAQINANVGRESVWPYALDVSDVSAVRSMVKDFAGKHGQLDIMVANAGITNYGEFLTYTPEAFDRLLAVNLRGTYFTAQAAAHAMIAGQTSGRIILTSSITGVQAFLNLSAYGMTKAGIRMMARSLGMELGPHKITVNAIVPGAILTERTLLDDPNWEENWSSVTPLGRGGYVEDITGAVLFLASPEAQHITGQSLVIDGGWSLQSPIPSNHPDKPDHSSQLR